MENRKVNLLLAVLLIVVVTVLGIVNPADAVYFQLVEDAIYIDGPDEFQYDIPLDEVEQFLLEENPAYAGDKVKDVVCGGGTDAVWGEYTQCVYARVPVCIAVVGRGETFLFNTENEEATRSLYEALLEYSAS